MFDILIADDDKNTRLLLGTVLEKAGYRVLPAENGEEALRLIEREHIDLAVVDIMMPKLDGYTLTELLRSAGNTMPILMVSAKQLPADKHRGFALGIDDYIVKPIEKEEFLYRVKALLRRAQIASEHRLTVGEVTLDYDAMTVCRGGHCQTLPQKEFLLLYKLLSYPGRIFTRIQLMDEIWGPDSTAGWETVTVHIARLRKRFEDFPEFEIEAVRGLGYRAVKRV